MNQDASDGFDFFFLCERAAIYFTNRAYNLSIKRPKVSQYQSALEVALAIWHIGTGLLNDIRVN
jgi:hypothetical protein